MDRITRLSICILREDDEIAICVYSRYKIYKLLLTFFFFFSLLDCNSSLDEVALAELFDATRVAYMIHCNFKFILK